MKDEEKLIKNLYAVFTVSLFMCFVPNLPAAIIAMVLFMGVLIVSYILRARTTKDTLLYDHTSYIIRTIWIAGLFSVVTVSAATFYLLTNLDIMPFQICVEQSGGLSATTPDALKDIALACMNDYIEMNKMLLLKATLFAGLPLILYMIYRLSKGIMRAAKGHRIGDYKNWF